MLFRKVEIEGHRYRIRSLPKRTRIKADGDVDSDRRILRVNNELPNKDWWVAFFHETDHAVLFENGYTANEGIVDTISSGTVRTLTENTNIACGLILFLMENQKVKAVIKEALCDNSQ